MQLEVRGSNAPAPITEWSQLPLDPQCKGEREREREYL